MDKLIEGLQSFRQQELQVERALFNRLAKGQNPDVLFITCSDSRIDPNLITKTKPGDLFVIRNAGNIVPPSSAPISGEVATLEYAVKALKVKDIIVCGHSSCGAVTALLHPEKAAGLGAVKDWLKYSTSVFHFIDEVKTEDPAERLKHAIRLNVLVQLGHIAEQGFIRDAVNAGDVRLHGWVYEIGEGQVEAYCGQKDEWIDLIAGGAKIAALHGSFESLEAKETATLRRMIEKTRKEA
jgi:carbonic anhydrase